ncbi:HD domain protein [[Eubacterium] yurii subsp. margaretiae ATCC 43715]|nr:HD domain protein [[Eubacterium] yurii subsp. margaretiae ATCC 43715]
MNISKDTEFVILLEEMKKINRQTKIIGSDRRENDAEHSWHVATMSMFLQHYSKSKVDVNKVIQMLLIHDLVEIFAGDTFAYDTNGYQDKFKRESDAMEKLKTYLSKDMGDMLESLWMEFENMESNESKFANAMDRLQPMLSNICCGEHSTWVEKKIKVSQVLKRMEIIKEFSQDIYDFLYEKLKEQVEKGYLIAD